MRRAETAPAGAWSATPLPCSAMRGKRLGDAPSEQWLGTHSDRPLVRASGLWNNNHVEEHYGAGFLDEFAALVER